MSTRTSRDLIMWGALGCALVSTAHAEYTLATAAHFNEYVAMAVPGALDLYVISALQQRRDVFVAVLAMVAASVASHLIAGGVLPVEWPVIAAVGAIAPLIVWRVYSLKYARTRQELPGGMEAGTGPEDAGAVSAPVPEAVPVDMTNWAPGLHLDGCDGVHGHEGPFHCQVRAGELEYAAPDHVPAEWVRPGTPDTYPPPVPVPDLPDEYASGAVHSAVLQPGDEEYLPVAREYAAGTGKPTVAGMKAAASVGQSRATRLLAYLETEETP